MVLKNKSTESRWLLKNSKPIYSYITILCILNIVASMFDVVFAILSKEIIDMATGKYTANVLTKSLTLVLFIFIQLGLRTLIGYVSARASNKFEMQLKGSLFKSVLKKEWLLISKYHSGDLVSRLNNDVSVITNGLISFIPGIISLLTGLIASFYVLVTLDYVFAIIILLIGPVFLVFGYIYGKIIKKMHIKCMESGSAIRSYIQESIQNLIVIKTFGKEDLDSDKFNLLQNINYKLQMKRSLFGLVSSGGMYLGFWAGYCFAIIWGSYRLSTGFITFGTLTIFFQLSARVQGPFMSLGSMVSSIYASFASAGRLMEIENISEEKNIGSEIIDDFIEISFKDVYYRYDKEVILENISLKIQKGEFVVIAGESGEGKTTLLRLLLGLISPESGSIQVKYENDKYLHISKKTRNLFAYVPQGNIVFSGTIRENITFANPNASYEEIVSAAKCACIWDFISELPQELDTPIGERGLGLSEGQAQRLAIARAILSKSTVLILDEATSALDNQTEIQVLKNIRNLDYLSSCIIVSHRETAFDFCDCVFNITNGSISKK